MPSRDARLVTAVTIDRH